MHKETDGKRKYRDSSAGDNKNSKVEEGTKRRRAHNKDVGEKIQKLTVKVKVLVNSKRRLERKNSRLEKIVEDREVEDVEMIEEDDNIDSQKKLRMLLFFFCLQAAKAAVTQRRRWVRFDVR